MKAYKVVENHLKLIKEVMAEGTPKGGEHPLRAWYEGQIVAHEEIIKMLKKEEA